MRNDSPFSMKWQSLHANLPRNANMATAFNDAYGQPQAEPQAEADSKSSTTEEDKTIKDKLSEYYDFTDPTVGDVTGAFGFPMAPGFTKVPGSTHTYDPSATATAGQTDPDEYRAQLESDLYKAQQELIDLQNQAANDPSNRKLQSDLRAAQANYQNAYTSYQANAFPDYATATGATYRADNVQKAEVGNIQTDSQQMIDANAGQITGAVPTAQAGQAGPASTATAPQQTQANTYQSQDVTPEMQAQLDQQSAAQGQVSQNAQVQAAEMSADELAQLGLTAPQIEEYQKAVAAKRQVQQGELVSGSAVDMQQVNEQASFEAAQATPSAQATTQGQMDLLMQDFEDGQTPAWAAGAMREATAVMQSRGLGASSMAGQAVIQATMEAAVPIAMADAQTFAQFESQNLSNRQESAMFGAQQRAQFLGMEFDQEFQSRVLNAAAVADVANMNFSAEQQVALENARLAQSVDISNLNSRQAKLMADAAAMSQLDMQNLNNRQQAQVQNAQNFLQMDMQNLSNDQQMQMFKSQSLAQSLLSDQAAANAAKQFNAASENQVDQFFADMEARVSQFNADQKNAIEMFNAGEAGATERFNAQQQAARDQFNAQNHLIVQQANAQWRQTIATTEFQAQQQANMEYASTANAFTTKALDEIWQRERDIMSFAWQSSENAAERAMNLLIADKQSEAAEAMLDKELEAADNAAMGAMTYDVLFGSGGSSSGGLVGSLF